MNLKIDTKEKFNEISINETNLSANMTGELHKSLTPLLQSEIKNVVLSLAAVENIDNACAREIASLQQIFYENNASFVICGLQASVQKLLDEYGLLDQVNITPTLSEAWDIVQMEEIERELLDNF